MCMVGNWFAGRLPWIHCNNVISSLWQFIRAQGGIYSIAKYSLWYLLPTKIKTEDTGQFKSTLSDSRLLFSDLRLTGDRFLWGSWFALDCKRYKNTSCFSTAYIQQEGCCQLNMCVAGSASTLTCYQTNFHQPTNEADFNNNFFAKSLIIVFQ